MTEDQDTPIPGVKTFIRTTRASVLAKGSHSLDFLHEASQEMVRSRALSWTEDRFIVLYDDGHFGVYTEEEWSLRVQELFNVAELIETVSGAEEPAIFEFGDRSEYDKLVNWANKLDGGPSEIPEDLKVGDILVRRPGGTYQTYRIVGRDRTEVGLPADFFDVERAHLRLELYKSSYPYEAGSTRLKDAQEAESWIFDASDKDSDG